VARLLDLVRLPPEVARLKPGQLSGGQKQRVAIARAFAGEPRIIVADEPTSALDTSVKAAILELLLDVQSRTGTSLVFISHDLPVVRYLADRILVMYRGRAVEAGPARRVFEPPYHPYTESLLASVPEIESDRRTVHASTDETDLMEAAAGAGCPFAGRCGRELPGGICREVPPPPRQVADGHVILCHRTLDELRAVPPISQRHHIRLPEMQP
jgi:peptide/nickel transport system ATP-binding protein